MHPTIGPNNNCNLQVSKSNSLLLDFTTCNNYSNKDDEDLTFIIGGKTVATIFLPYQVALVLLLLKARRDEGGLNPKMASLGEETEILECNVQALTNNLEDMHTSLQKAKKNLFFLQQKKHSLEQDI
jgi:hypothetical protein